MARIKMTTIPQIQHPAAAHTISSSADPRPEPCKPVNLDQPLILPPPHPLAPVSHVRRPLLILLRIVKPLMLLPHPPHQLSCFHHGCIGSRGAFLRRRQIARAGWIDQRLIHTHPALRRPSSNSRRLDRLNRRFLRARHVGSLERWLPSRGSSPLDPRVPRTWRCR